VVERYAKNAGAVFSLKYHIVRCPKYRRPVLVKPVDCRLKVLLQEKSQERWLVNRYGVIAVEDLNIKGLSRGMLARPANDAGWNSFFQKLSYKAEEAGRELVKVDPRGTSQTCVCGTAVPKTLADRWHECPTCGLSAPRDVVSAQVILQRARIGRSRLNVEAVGSSVPREAVCFS